MRRFLLTLVVLVLAVITFLPGESARAWQTGNLLENPGFEGPFYAWSGMNEVHVAHGWTPWWRYRNESDQEAYFFKPEYKQANGWIYPNRVHGGASAQQWFTFFATHQAGLYQQVFNVRPGTGYRFTVWAQVWSSTEDDASVSRNPAYPNMQVGIDPTGGRNAWAGTVVWSGTYAFYDSWGQLAIEAVAQNDVITVFMRSDPHWPVKHNDFYWDDAALVVAGQPIPPAPPPTATSAGPAPPTATAAATPEPTATCAPAPSDWVTYYVVKGDTLYSLSRRSGTKVERIKSVNCLSSTTIHVGQALLLPRQPDTPTPTKVPHTPIPVTPTTTGAPTATQTPRPETPTITSAPTATGTPTAAAPATPTRAPTATASATRTKSPTVTASATPTRTPTEPPPTAAPATATSVPKVVDTPTPTKPPPTILPPPTSTPGSPTPRPTSTPSASSTRPCGTIYVGAGIVVLAGFFRFRRRGKPFNG